MKTGLKRIITLGLSALLMVGAIGCNKAETNSGGVQTLTDDLTTIVEKIYEKNKVEIAVESKTIDLKDGDMLKYNTGLSDSSKIKEVVVSEALISSQAYSMVLVRVNDTKDAKDVATEMQKGIDPRKWICVMADDMKVVSTGDVVLLVMTDSALGGNITSEKIVNAFKEVAGVEKFDVEL